MCGIIGSNYNINLNSSFLHHRGPNNFSIYKDKYITLSHNRLSIIDLNTQANQPFYFKDLILIFNGEIYNYKEIKKELEEYQFKTTSDTEVLLYSYHKWGKKCLEKFNGDFAFCIYNRTTKKLFCARDRLGNKPFYYYRQNDRFIFASEIKAFKDFIDLKFDHQKVCDSILFSINDNDETTNYKDIYNLKNGHFLEYDLNNNELNIEKYWDLPVNDNAIKEFDKKDFNDKLEQFDELLDNAVQLRLLSDVSVGSMLSGGIDSSLIAYYIQKHHKDINFYSIVYDHFNKINESKFIKIIQKEFNLNVTYLKPEFKDLKNDIQDLINTQDDIFRSLSIYAQYYLFKHANVSVMLSGQGADELFGGYHLHSCRALINNKKELLSRIDIYGSSALDELKAGIKLSLPNKQKLRLLKDDNKENIKIINSIYKEYSPNWNLIIDKLSPSFEKALINETMSYNLPMLLRYEDRNAMRFSIENRTPFTDYRVAEFAHTLPNSYKFKDGYNKYILRELANKHLPNQIAFRKDKIGFAAPENEWIANLGLGNSLVEFRLSIAEHIKEQNA